MLGQPPTQRGLAGAPKADQCDVALLGLGDRVETRIPTPTPPTTPVCLVVDNGKEFRQYLSEYGSRT